MARTAQVRRTYANIIATMQSEVRYLIDRWGFDVGTGWIQVVSDRDDNIERVIGYGRMRALLDMIQRLDGGHLVEAD